LTSCDTRDGYTVNIEPANAASRVRVRFEESDDIPAVRLVNQKAFGRDSEARTVDELRSAGAVTLSVVAVVDGEESAPEIAEDVAPATMSAWGGEGHGWNEGSGSPSGPGGPRPDWAGGRGIGRGRVVGGRVIGHALISPVTVITNRGNVPLLGLGPVAVLPEFQGQGIGTLLVEACLEQLRESGFAGVVVVGDPAYYSRFGFITASRWGLKWEVAVPDDHFMVLELSPGKLAGIAGIVRYRPEFTADAAL
jgi:putative acetyltransferase